MAAFRRDYRIKRVGLFEKHMALHDPSKDDGENTPSLLPPDDSYHTSQAEIIQKRKKPVHALGYYPLSMPCSQYSPCTQIARVNARLVMPLFVAVLCKSVATCGRSSAEDGRHGDCSGLASISRAYPSCASPSSSSCFRPPISTISLQPSSCHSLAFDDHYSGSSPRTPCCSASNFLSITRPA